MGSEMSDPVLKREERTESERQRHYEQLSPHTRQLMFKGLDTEIKDVKSENEKLKAEIDELKKQKPSFCIKARKQCYYQCAAYEGGPITATDIKIGSLKSDIRILMEKNARGRDRLEIAVKRSEEFQDDIVDLEATQCHVKNCQSRVQTPFEADARKRNEELQEKIERLEADGHKTNARLCKYRLGQCQWQIGYEEWYNGGPNLPDDVDKSKFVGKSSDVAVEARAEAGITPCGNAEQWPSAGATARLEADDQKAKNFHSAFVDQCVEETLKAKIRELEAWKADVEESTKSVMDETCRPPDEKHCTCVPVLRAEIESLKSEIGGQKDTNWSNTGYWENRVEELKAKIEELEKWKADAVEDNKKVFNAASGLQVFYD